MAIKMTPDEIRDLASTIEGIKEEILNQVTTMDSRINSDTAEWDGESKVEYFGAYEAIIPTLKETFPQVIEELGTKLIFAADKLEEADQQIASKMRG